MLSDCVLKNRNENILQKLMHPTERAFFIFIRNSNHALFDPYLLQPPPTLTRDKLILPPTESIPRLQVRSISLGISYPI